MQRPQHRGLHAASVLAGEAHNVDPTADRDLRQASLLPVGQHHLLHADRLWLPPQQRGLGKALRH